MGSWEVSTSPTHRRTGTCGSLHVNRVEKSGNFEIYARRLNPKVERRGLCLILMPGRLIRSKKKRRTFNLRQTCGCIHQEGRRRDQAHVYSELLHNVSRVRKTKVTPLGSRVQARGIRTPFSFGPVEDPHPAARNLKEHENPQTALCF